MIKLKQTTSFLLFFLTGAMLITGLLAFLSLRLSVTAASLQREVDQLTLDAARFDEQSALYAAYASRYADWSRLLPVTEGEVAIVAATLEQLAASHSLTILLNFDDFPGAVETSGKLHWGLGLDLNLDGAYQNLVAFTAELSKLPYFYRIDKLILTQQETGNGVKANFQGVLFMNQATP